jgi:hypothetical protein
VAQGIFNASRPSKKGEWWLIKILTTS